MPVANKTRNRVTRGRFKTKHAAIADQQADLLRRVRAKNGLSRIDLARGLNLAPSTVGIYVDHLVEEGFLFEGRATDRDFGRPPTILTLNPQRGRFIGVDFEARNIMAVAVDFSLNRLREFHDTIAATDSVEKILRKIEHAIDTVAEEDSRPVLGIGVGVPGVIDPATGMARKYKHIPGWEDVPLVARLTKRFGVPVFLENNIRSMALAELWFGQGRGVNNFICLGVRSGIGAGIIINREVYHGADNRAGEIGDWPCALSGGKKFGRLEEIVSFASVRNRMAHSPAANPDSLVAPGTDVHLDGLIKAAEAGDKSVLAILDGAARTFGLALNQLNCAFNPQIIIMAGVFTAFGEIFLKRLNQSLKTFAPTAGVPTVVNSKLGNFNGALGAAALAVHEWKPIAQ